jgi:hypothetical protein
MIPTTHENLRDQENRETWLPCERHRRSDAEALGWSASRRSDAGELCPSVETIDDEILTNALKFVDKARQNNKPFFLWSTRPACTSSHTCRPSTKMRTGSGGRFTRPAWRNWMTSGSVMRVSQGQQP